MLAVDSTCRINTSSVSSYNLSNSLFSIVVFAALVHSSNRNWSNMNHGVFCRAKILSPPHEHD